MGPDALLSLPVIQKLLQDPSRSVRVEAAHTILCLKPSSAEAIDVLFDGLSDRETSVRLLAIYAFNNLRLTEKKVVVALLEASSSDVDELVRCEALECLAGIGLPQKVVIPALEARLMDGSEKVRATAAVKLGRVKDEKLTVPPLLRALQDMSPRVRACAAEALGRHGKAAVSALPALKKVWQDDPDSHVRDAAARALMQIEKEQEKRQ